MLKTFIRMIIEADETNFSSEVDKISSILQQIVKRFPHNMAYSREPFSKITNAVFSTPFIVDNDAEIYDTYKKTWQRFKDDIKFRLLISKNFIYKKNVRNFDISFSNNKVVNVFTRHLNDILANDASKQSDIAFEYDKKLYGLSRDDLQKALKIAKNYDEFEVIIKKMANVT